MNIHSERVAAIRAMMAEKGWDAVVISASDPHASEYPAPRWQQVGWVSGFTGEAGDIVITRSEAGLWTDSRYFIQAEAQLEGSGIALHRLRMPGTVDIPRWIAERARFVAVDGRCMSVDAVADIEGALKEAHEDSGVEYKVVNAPDMLDALWQDRPWVPAGPVFTLDEDMVGESRQHKVTWLRKFLMKEGCDSILLSSLDEIAWLLNVRGSDIEYNPFVISYLYVSLDRVCWYVLKNVPGKRDQDTVDSISELEGDGVEVFPYEEVFVGLSDMEDGERIFIDTSTLNVDLYRYIMGSYGEQNVVKGVSPVILRKAVKNGSEIRALREAYMEDGLAVEKFLYWLEGMLSEGVTEWEASIKLTALRSEITGYRGNSFENISAYGANAALPHYSTPEQGSAVIRPRGLYLVDSGGQYLSGTTDITRTVPVGECTDLEKEDYTLVLKGMIDLAMAVFPKGTAGCHLDVLARNALWRSKRNFGHGTGHGVGFWLGVHEGPQSIRQNFNPQPLLPGMVTSDEPGIYREGMHGVRHENILLCREAGTNSFGEWLCFETLTLCHIDTSAIVRELMTEDEIAWLNAYNSRVYQTLSPHLPSDIAAWLRTRTSPVE